MVLLCADVAQKPGEDRPSLFTRNAEVFREIVPKLERVGFRGIYLVVTNPVDALTALTWRLSSLPASRVIGSGTVLDSARLRFLLGGHFSVSPQSIHAYVLGEHGDSEFVPWSIATIGGKSLLEICKGSAAPSCDGDKCSIGGGFLCDERCLAEMEEEVRDAGARIIEAKGSTCYGIGMSAARIVKAILLDEHAVLPLSISTELSEMHQGLDVFTGIPAVVGRHGILETVELPLREDEEENSFFPAVAAGKFCIGSLRCNRFDNFSGASQKGVDRVYRGRIVFGEQKENEPSANDHLSCRHITLVGILKI